MIFKIHSSTSYLWMKRGLFVALVAYGAIVSVVILRINPTPILIAIDETGTRTITSQNDRLLKIEKKNLLRDFLQRLYTYDETDFSERVSLAGDLMGPALWQKRTPDFEALVARLKTEPLSQRITKISDLRVIDDLHYEADLDLGIQSHLKHADVKLRVGITLGAAARTELRPYPYEVITYDEQTIQ